MGCIFQRIWRMLFVELNKKTAQESRQALKNAGEEEAARKLHFSLGRWIIYNWGFYEGSRLSHYLKGLGVSHPDDQAKFIITTYHRYLNNVPLAVKDLADFYREKRQKILEERKKKGTILYEEKRKRDN